MHTLAKLVSLLSLSAVILPCLLYFAGYVDLIAVKQFALAGTVGWFIATPLWMGRKLPLDATEVEI